MRECRSGQTGMAKVSSFKKTLEKNDVETMWLSAYKGSNPFSRIFAKDYRKN